ncbi:hypothetical protein ACFZAM_03430 [Streptomyces sp. NPDC008079]|uniref:hypothetical protein n=1 Tax=Streptomyces sp. NPDC008079 TaxID=3364806 RepID=UPI0036E0224C
MSTPTGPPEDPRIPHQNGAVPQVDQQQTPPARQTPPVQPAQRTQPARPAQPGYGFPPTQFSQPVHQGSPYEIRPGVPQIPHPQPYVPNPNEPDWSALADQHVAEQRARKKRMLIIAVSAVVVLALAGGAALFLMGGSKKDGDTVAKGDKDKQTTAPAVQPSDVASDSPSTEPTGSPSGSPTGSPSATSTPTMQGKDLFSDTSTRVNGQTFTRKTTSHEAPCWKATRSGLGPTLGPNKCAQVVLATYTSAKSSVTVGVMVFPSAKEANAVNSAFKGELIPLTNKSGIPNFCEKVACAVTHAVHDRYLYTTIAGPNNGTAGVKDDDAIAAGQGIAGYTLTRLTELD